MIKLSIFLWGYPGLSGWAQSQAPLKEEVWVTDGKMLLALKVISSLLEMEKAKNSILHWSVQKQQCSANTVTLAWRDSFRM